MYMRNFIEDGNVHRERAPSVFGRLLAKKDSVMCQQGQGRTATKPNTTEASVVNHLY